MPRLVLVPVVRPDSVAPRTLARGGLVRRDTMFAKETTHSMTATILRPLTRDFLSWLAAAPRPYPEVMDAWRSSCPRLTIWEDALADGYVRVESGSDTPAGSPLVVLTPSGRAALDGCAR